MRIGTIINRWRLLAQKELNQVADEMGVSRSALKRIESGTVPDGGTLLKLQSWLFESEDTNGTGKSAEGIASEHSAVGQQSGDEDPDRSGN